MVEGRREHLDILGNSATREGNSYFPLLCAILSRDNVLDTEKYRTIKPPNNSGKYFCVLGEWIMQRITIFKADREVATLDALLTSWRQYLQEQDHSPGTIKKYTQAVLHFLAWYEQEEHMPLQLSALTQLPSLAIIMSFSMNSINPSVRSTCVSAHCAPGVSG